MSNHIKQNTNEFKIYKLKIKLQINHEGDLHAHNVDCKNIQKVQRLTRTLNEDKAGSSGLNFSDKPDNTLP